MIVCAFEAFQPLHVLTNAVNLLLTHCIHTTEMRRPSSSEEGGIAHQWRLQLVGEPQQLVGSCLGGMLPDNLLVSRVALPTSLPCSR